MRQPKPKIELSPCPFCGSSKAPLFWNSDDMNDPDSADYGTHSLAFAVVCDASTPRGRGGCGGSGGFKVSVHLAADAWNKRA
jgi:hypothetical protein